MVGSTQHPDLPRPLARREREAQRTAFCENITKAKVKGQKMSKSTVVPKPINNPSTVGLAGKAGKTHFFIRVGAVENPHKTKKYSSTKESGGARIEFDLHAISNAKL